MQRLFEPIPASPIENVIPDCCNIGTMVRALLFVNGVVLAVMLLTATGLQAGLSAFVEASLLIELACLTSLFALCGMRRLIRTMPLWCQRLACAAVPAAITGAIIHYFLANASGMISLTRVSVAEGMAGAALFGIVLQHYFELRTRAFSPALAEARLQALQARIRPHFLFNSLNAVLSLIRSEPRRAENTLEDLADLFRVLMRDTRDITTLADEVSIGKQYLAIEKIRLGERLQVAWDIQTDDALMQQTAMPALLLQPLLENAVHYGVEPSPDAACIRITIARIRDRIEIVMTNPYHADAVSVGNHMALDNIRERLTLLYDVEAQLTTVMQDGVFELRLVFPFQKGEA
ncbi:histidine kinase [uncultured Oxalicibacterium sp.]|uniref:sensor histidine kinase n=1 Tax=uncultured Oxalicibacterium sp. TaxID=1168540 RepID=UPI0025D9BD2A|nr:histidine kinase [uncultured Oxalicibacterium sp.]